MARILVVDNEAPSRDLLRLHLETAGHQVFAAEDSIAGRERGHHGNTCACATTVSGAAGSASGGTASTRSAPETMLLNTGAAMSPP